VRFQKNVKRNKVYMLNIPYMLVLYFFIILAVYTVYKCKACYIYFNTYRNIKMNLTGLVTFPK